MSVKLGIGQLFSTQISPSNKSAIQNLVELACNPDRPEPDLAMNLEICDFINTKQKNIPNDAALAILTCVNSRDLHESMLALEVFYSRYSIKLLDNCVKNCGYAFHLQVASKEFLNELVKRFPERPPHVLNPNQDKILELLQQWNFALFETSKYRHDMRNIHDMFQLLRSKGYLFPELRAETANVLRAGESLKTRDEMEEEDRLAQSAKLQELLRRGTPADLQAANDLMKVMTGYLKTDQNDYRKKESDELDKIDEKTSQLRDLLHSLPSDIDVSDHVKVQELLSSVKTSQPKITKWIEDNLGEEDEKSRIDRLLYLNDLMNEVVGTYEWRKKNIGRMPPTAQAAIEANQPADVALIDFDSFPSSQPTQLSQNFPIYLPQQQQPFQTNFHPPSKLQQQQDQLQQPQLLFQPQNPIMAPQKQQPVQNNVSGKVQITPSSADYFGDLVGLSFNNNNNNNNNRK